MFAKAVGEYNSNAAVWVLEGGWESFSKTYPFLCCAYTEAEAEQENGAATTRRRFGAGHKHIPPFPWYPSEIIDGRLWLGSHVDAESKEQMTKVGITHILNVSTEVESPFEDTFTYNNLKFEDKETVDVGDRFNIAFDWLDSVLEDPKNRVLGKSLLCHAPRVVVCVMCFVFVYTLVAFCVWFYLVVLLILISFPPYYFFFFSFVFLSVSISCLCLLPSLSPSQPVHCHQGVSRSATIVFGYIMKHMRWPLVKTFKFVKERRKQVFPNIGFWKQLGMFYSFTLLVSLPATHSLVLSPPAHTCSRFSSLSSLSLCNQTRLYRGRTQRNANT